MNRPRKRYPKGTYMKLISADRLRAFVGPEPDKKMSGRRLARGIGKHPSYIDHLLQGRCTTANPVTAQRIAETLEVPLDLLFDPKTSPNSSRNVDRGQAA